MRNFMRLSLQKAAQVDVRQRRVQEIRVAPAYVGRKRWATLISCFVALTNHRACGFL
jgi:hypothetical protein